MWCHYFVLTGVSKDICLMTQSGFCICTHLRPEIFSGTLTTLMQNAFHVDSSKQQEGNIFNHLCFVQRKFLSIGSCQPDTKITNSKNRPACLGMHPQYGYDWVKSVVCLADTMTQRVWPALKSWMARSQSLHGYNCSGIGKCDSLLSLLQAVLGRLHSEPHPGVWPEDAWLEGVLQSVQRQVLRSQLVQGKSCCSLCYLSMYKVGVANLLSILCYLILYKVWLVVCCVTSSCTKYDLLFAVLPHLVQSMTCCLLCYLNLYKVGAVCCVTSACTR